MGFASFRKDSGSCVSIQKVNIIRIPFFTPFVCDAIEITVSCEMGLLVTGIHLLRERQANLNSLCKVNCWKQQFQYFCFEVGVCDESASYYAKEHENHTHKVLGFVWVMVTGGGEKFIVLESGGGIMALLRHYSPF